PQVLDTITIIDAITYFIIVCYNTIEESVCFGNDMTVSSFNRSLSFSVLSVQYGLRLRCVGWGGLFRDNRFSALTKNDLKNDRIAGITVGVVAIPLGMAFAIASGVNPEYGIYTTIIAGLIVALIGGSHFQIAGPTGAFIPILLAIVLQYGYEDLL